MVSGIKKRGREEEEERVRRNETASNRLVTCKDSITGHKMAHWLPNQFAVDAT